MEGFFVKKGCGMLEIIEVTKNDTAALEQVKALIREYVAWLNVDLSFQHFEEEMASLPEMYAAPGGALFLARENGQPAGCVAVRRFDNTTCEMKRLFVRDAHQGHGVGKALAAKAIEAGKKMGYHRMLLDTMANMRPAIELYTALGFQPIAAYYDNPISNAVYLSMMLEDQPL
jgi:ribosomal protein S18 acetylase RimI-like enzyme